MVDFYCPFQLDYYPFDGQNCPIILINKGDEGENIEFIQDKLTYLGPTTMKQYQIGTPEFVSTKDNTIKVEIKFRRDTMSELLTTILPTVLIVIVSYFEIYQFFCRLLYLNNFFQSSFATNYFIEEHFEAIVTVNLTALLVMVTLFIGMSQQ